MHRYPRLDAIYHALGKEQGWRIVAAVRLSHSLPFGLQNFLLGVSPVGFWAYLLTTWLITLPGIFGFAYLGHLAGTALTGDQMQETAGPWWWIIRGGGLAIAAGAIFYLGRLAYRAIRDHVPRQNDSSKIRNETERPQAGPQAGPQAAWPWGTTAALLTAAVFLLGAVWCYVQRDSLRDLF